MSATSNTNFSSGIEIISPDEALRILNTQASNRPVSEGFVKKYAADMAAGAWELTGEAIKFDDRDRLLDGQHRLHAVVLSDTATAFFVVRGVHGDLQDVMDSGRKRTLADQLAMRGYHHYTSLAAGVNSAIALQTVGKVRGFTPTVRDALAWLEDNPLIAQSVEPTKGVLRRPLNYWSGPAIALHYRMALLSPSDADYFWGVLGSGGISPGTEPILMLRERIIAEKRGAVKAMEPNYGAAITIKAWNAWLTGEVPKFLRWRPGSGEEFPTLLNPNEL